MITEDYVSFEVAKLLKEKGFDGITEKWYLKYKGEYTLVSKGTAEHPDSSIDVPTIQMAMKWLREVYSLHCNSDYDFVLGWYCQITSLKETVEYDYEEMKHYHPEKDSGFSSPEEACEAAIKYCLENLV